MSGISAYYFLGCFQVEPNSVASAPTIPASANAWSQAAQEAGECKVTANSIAIKQSSSSGIRFIRRSCKALSFSVGKVAGFTVNMIYHDVADGRSINHTGRVFLTTGLRLPRPDRATNNRVSGTAAVCKSSWSPAMINQSVLHPAPYPVDADNTE